MGVCKRAYHEFNNCSKSHITHMLHAANPRSMTALCSSFTLPKHWRIVIYGISTFDGRCVNIVYRHTNTIHNIYSCNIIIDILDGGNHID